MKLHVAALVLFATALHATPPLVDHHQHIISGQAAQLFNGPLPLPAMALPDDLARLMRLRAERWDDEKGLAELYSENAVALRNYGQQFGWERGRADVARLVSQTYARPFTITPAAYRIDGSAGSIAANLTRGEGTPGRRHFGVIHFGLEKGSDGVWRIASETFATPTATQQEYGADQLIKALDEAGIQRAVLLSVAGVYGGSVSFASVEGEPEEARYAKLRAENDWVAREAAKYPKRLVAFCSFNPLAAHAIPEIRRCKSAGFHGVKLHLEESGIDLLDPEHVKTVRALFAESNRLGLPIMVHPGNNQREGRARAKVLFDQILTATPDIVVQIAHLWGGNDFSEQSNETLAAYAEYMQAKHPATKNLWFDMSESAMIAAWMGDRQTEVLNIIATRIRQIGIKRVLYGTDGPALIGHMTPKDAWEQFRKLVPLTEEEFNTIATNVAPYMK
ncbi:MAG TPA: amidohydrolase family protein [Thermoanaerobaculia bacterium]|jgi:predicted TIM-barrel fold metal-dependent hydrolase